MIFNNAPIDIAYNYLLEFTTFTFMSIDFSNWASW